MNIAMWYGCFVGVFTSPIVMCKYSWQSMHFLYAHVISTFLNWQQLATVRLDIDDNWKDMALVYLVDTALLIL